MLRRLSLLVVVLTVSACGGSGATRPADGAHLTAEDLADLAFFAQIGFQDVKGLPFVEVQTGGWKGADGEVHLETARGFLREVRDDGTIEVLTGELFPVVWRLTAGDVPPEKEISYRTLDLAEVVRECLTGGKPRTHWDLDEPRDRRYAERLPSEARRVALALACSRQGLHVEAHTLLVSVRGKGPGVSGERYDRPLGEVLYDALAESVIWRAVEAFGEAEVSREELLRVFRAHVATFPKSEHAETSASAVEMLARMVAEDEQHARDAKPLASMTRAEQIDEWIFRLRDQNGHQIMQPGAPSVFVLPGYGQDSPAHCLVEFGYDAVPRLLEVLDDERFTRTVGFWRDFHYSHYVVRAGNAAAEVLGEITGQRFSRGADGTKSSPDQRRKRWRQWWETFSKDGVDAGLAAEVRRGGADAWSAAKRLVERDPRAALRVLLEGVANAKEGHARSSLVDLMAQVPGQEQLAFMQLELRERHGLHDRLRAARWLDRHGHREGFEAVHALWESVRTQETPDSQAITPTAICLGILGTEEAMRTLLAGLSDLSVAMRGQVLYGLTSPAGRREEWASLDPVAERLMVDYLGDSLDDDSELFAGYWMTRAPETDTLRICEVAAGRLAYFWHDEGVAYTQQAFRGDRDRQIHAIRNHWRAKRGLEPLPAPDPPDLPGLGNRVREVEVLPAGASLGPAGARCAEDLLDREISAQTFAGLVDVAVRERQEGSPGVEAVLWRPGDGTGIVVTLTILDPVEPEQLWLGSWDTRIQLRCGRAEKMNVSWGGGGSLDENAEPAPALGKREEFVRELDRALARAFDLAIRAVVSVRQPSR